MKAVFLTAITLVVYLLLSTLLPIEEATVLLDSQLVMLDKVGPTGAAENEQAASLDSLLIRGEEAFSTVSLPNTALRLAPVDDSGVLAAMPAAAPATVEWPLEDPQLEAFAAAIINGQADQLVGVYAPDIFALPVMQQPFDQPNFVSEQDGMITQFSTPNAYGSIGLLAHNYLSGASFFDLAEDQEVILIQGDGYQMRYRIADIKRYQALNPTSVYSTFADLENPTQTTITAGELFNRVYTTPDQVVFQTCIEAYGDPSWGRIFITAERIVD